MMRPLAARPAGLWLFALALAAAIPAALAQSYSLVVTTTSANIAIPAASPAVIAVSNAGSNPMWVNPGTSSAVVATTGNISVPAGCVVPLTVGSSTYVAAISTGGSTTMNLGKWTGDLNPFCSGGGSGGVPGSVTTNPSSSVPSTQSAFTVTTGNTFQQVLAANAARTYCFIQNTSTHTAYVYWLATGTASLTNSAQVPAGSAFTCANGTGGVIRTAIQWTTGTTSDPGVATENQ